MIKKNKKLKESIMFILIILMGIKGNNILGIPTINNNNSYEYKGDASKIKLNQTNIVPILTKTREFNNEGNETHKNIDQLPASRKSSLAPIIKEKMSILNLKGFGKKKKHLKKKKTKKSLKKKNPNSKSHKKILSVQSNKLVKDENSNNDKKLENIKLEIERVELKKKADVIPDRVFINLINQKKISDDLFIQEEGKDEPKTILTKYDKSTNSLKKERIYRKNERRLEDSIDKLKKDINEVKFVNFYKQINLKEEVDSEKSWLKFNNLLNVINVFPKFKDFDSLGSIELPSELLYKIREYHQKFIKFKNSVPSKNYKKNKKNFRKFMKEIYNSLKSETDILNRQKIMAQTKKYVRKEKKQKIKDDKIIKILKKISLKIAEDISNEKNKVSLNNYEPEELLKDEDKKQIYNNTKKIFELMDLSDFGNKKLYKKMKELLEYYMEQGQSGEIQLKSNNCLLEFKKSLLLLLENEN